MTAARALGQALARTAQDQMALPLEVAAGAEQRMTLADLPEALEERALLALIEGPGEGLGLVALGQPMLAALIEMQTMGRLGPAPPPPRRPTRTDATLAAGFIDQVLRALEEALAALPDIRWAGGFRYASFLDDPRPLGLLLEDTSYRVFNLTLDLGLGGARRGDFLLALPAAGRGPGPRPVLPARPAAEVLAPVDAGDDWADLIEAAVLSAPVVLEAVLYRVTVPLSAVLALQPGMDLPLPLAAVDRLQLEGLGGRALGQGRLGQSRGFRAVRLTAAGAASDDVPDDGPTARSAGTGATPPVPRSAAGPRPVPPSSVPPSLGAAAASSPAARPAAAVAAPLPGAEGADPAPSLPARKVSAGA